MAEVKFIPGEAEALLSGIGFDRARLADDCYVDKAIDIVGGLEALAVLQTSFRALLCLSRPQIMAELMVRLEVKQWRDKRDKVRYLPQAEIAGLVIAAECRNRFGWSHGDIADAELK